MRTDVKIGLISVFVVVVSLVGYLAYNQNKSGSTTPVPRPDPALNAPVDGARSPDDSSISLIAPPTTPTTGPTTLPERHDTTMPATTGPATTMDYTTGPTDLRYMSPGVTSTRPTLSESLVDAHRTTTTDSLLGTTDTTTSTDATTHVIAKGDTFGGLAIKYRTTIKAITQANPGVESSRLKIGQKINIPAGSTGTPGMPRVSSTPTDTDWTLTTPTTPTTPATSTTPRVAVAPAAPVRASAVPGGTYKVVKGDTLRKIAKRAYGSEKYWERIARVNRSKLRGNPSNLEVGTVLTLPPK